MAFCGITRLGKSTLLCLLTSNSQLPSKSTLLISFTTSREHVQGVIHDITMCFAVKRVHIMQNNRSICNARDKLIQITYVGGIKKQMWGHLLHLPTTNWFLHSLFTKLWCSRVAVLNYLRWICIVQIPMIKEWDLRGDTTSSFCSEPLIILALVLIDLTLRCDLGQSVCEQDPRILIVLYTH